jgi:hypothetical protein
MRNVYRYDYDHPLLPDLVGFYIITLTLTLYRSYRVLLPIWED